MGKKTGPFVMPDAYAVLIGRITETWAQLEFQIDMGIWELSGTHQQLAACITAQLQTAAPRLRAFIALAEVLGVASDTIKALNKFSSDRISGLTDKRNRAVHDPRSVDVASGGVFRLEITAKPKVHFGFKAESLESLERTHKQISDTVVDFMVLRDSVIREVKSPPPGKHEIALQTITTV